MCCPFFDFGLYLKGKSKKLLRSNFFPRTQKKPRLSKQTGPVEVRALKAPITTPVSVAMLTRSAAKLFFHCLKLPCTIRPAEKAKQESKLPVNPPQRGTAYRISACALRERRVALPTKRQRPNPRQRKGPWSFHFGDKAMNFPQNSPISVEILARCGRKFRIRLRIVVPVGFVLVLVSTVSKLIG